MGGGGGVCVWVCVSVRACAHGRALHRLLDAPVPTLDVTVRGDHSGRVFRGESSRRSGCQGRTTPESSTGSLRVNPPLKAVVFKSKKRVLTRF